MLVAQMGLCFIHKQNSSCHHFHTFLSQVLFSITAQRHNTFFKILVLENEIQVSLSLHTNFQAKLTIITIIQRHINEITFEIDFSLRRDGKLAPSLRILKMLKTTSSMFYFHLYVLTYVLYYGYEYFAGQKVPINYYLFEYKRKY